MGLAQPHQTQPDCVTRLWGVTRDDATSTCMRLILHFVHPQLCSPRPGKLSGAFGDTGVAWKCGCCPQGGREDCIHSGEVVVFWHLEQPGCCLGIASCSGTQVLQQNFSLNQCGWGDTSCECSWEHPPVLGLSLWQGRPQNWLSPLSVSQHSLCNRSSSWIDSFVWG